MTSAPVSRRERPAKPALSRELIVRAGLAILDAQGMDALTMRSVATALDTGAASLYVYVKNRDDLLDALLDEALGAVAFPKSDAGTWRDRLTLIVDRTTEAMARHDRLALVALGSIPSSPNALRILDNMVAALRHTSLDPEAVSYSVDLLYLYATAAAAEMSAYRSRLITRSSADGYVREVEAAYEKLSASDYPHLVALGPVMLSGSGDKRAVWMLRTLLNGILATPVDN